MFRNIFLITIILSIKLLIAIYLFQKTDCINKGKNTNSFLSLGCGDGFSYCGAMENYIQKGEYYFQNKENKKIYAGRMPLYTFHYFLLRQFFPISTTKTIMTLIAIFIESLTIFFLYKWFKDFFNNSFAAYSLLVFFLFEMHYTFFSLFDSPESLGISTLLLSFIFFLYYLKNKNKLHIVFSSVLLIYSTALKPYYGIVYGIFFLISLIYIKRKKDKIYTLLTYIFFMFIVITPWGIRNYMKTNGKIILLTEKYSGYSISESIIELRKYIAAMGESSEIWDKKAAGSFFHQDKETIWSINDFYKKGIDTVDLKKIQHLYTQLARHYSKKSDSILAALIRKKRLLYQKKHPFFSTFIAPFKLVKKSLFHSGSYFFPYQQGNTCSSTLDLLAKISISIFYYIRLIFGNIGLILMAYRKPYLSIFILFSFSIIFIFDFVLQVVELRYFFPISIFSIIGLSYLILTLYNHIKNNYTC